MFRSKVFETPVEMTPEAPAPAGEKYYTDSSMERFNRGGAQVPYIDHMPSSPCSTLKDLEDAIPEEPLDDTKNRESKEHPKNNKVEQKPQQPPPQQLTPAAIDKRLRRVMTPKSSGALKVPQEVIDQWKDPASRHQVTSMFEKDGYDPDWVGCPNKVFLFTLIQLCLFCLGLWGYQLRPCKFDKVSLITPGKMSFFT